MIGIHPWSWIPDRHQAKVFWLMLALTLGVMFALQLLGAPLVTQRSPAGIVSYELAGDIAQSQAMVAAWGEQGGIYAGLNLGLDYLFILAYATSIGLACVLVGRSLIAFPRWAALGNLLAWGLLVAATLDAVENYALIRILLGSQQANLAFLARWAALVKFALVLLAILYVLCGFVVSILRRKAKRVD
jgi:hypothetical protein